MITVFWGARHGQGVTTTLAQAAGAAGGNVRVVDLDPDCADLSLLRDSGKEGNVTIDALVEDAERGQIHWPEWARWHGDIQGITANPRRQVPLVASRDAAERLLEALKAVAEDGSHVLCDIGSGLRDYLTVRALSMADRVVVVTRTHLPDALATQTALAYISPRLTASDRVLATIGGGATIADMVKDARDWRLVQVPETPQAAGMRNSGRVVMARAGGQALLQVIGTDGGATRRGRRWPSQR